MKGIVTSLGVQETLPENWTYAGSSQTPVRSGGREIEWDYSVGVDETLTYTVVIPSGQVGDKNFSGVFFYTLNGDQITLEIDGSTVAIPIEHHSADYNKDWSISIDEIVYAARLYNVEAYYIGEGQDGYTTVISGRDSFPHSADLNQDWNIILDEIVYTARLYNAQSYKIGDGDDGYTAVNASGKRIGRRNVAVEPVKCVRTVKDGIDPGVVIVSLALESSEISSGLGVIEAFPESWQVVSVSPASSQQRGHRIEWFFPNAGDYSIEYSLNTNGNRTGSEAFSGQVIYTAGDEIVKENTLTANEDSTDVAYWMVY